ncbi:hypothetical protein VPH35_108811 [Triticum aestivum]
MAVPLLACSLAPQEAEPPTKKTRVENAQMRAAAGVRAVQHLIFFVCLCFEVVAIHGARACSVAPMCMQSVEMGCRTTNGAVRGDFGCCPMGAHVQCLWA